MKYSEMIEQLEDCKDHFETTDPEVVLVSGTDLIKIKELATCSDGSILVIPEPSDQCPTCGGIGGIDSGGMTPWGEGINIPCPSCSQPAPEPSSHIIHTTACAVAQFGSDLPCTCGGESKHEPSSQQGEWKIVPISQQSHFGSNWKHWIQDSNGNTVASGCGQTQQEAEATAKRICEAVKLQERFEWCGFSESALDGWEIQYRLDDGRHYVYDEKGNFVWSGEPKFNAWRCGQMDREVKNLRAELAKAREENGRLRKIINWLNEPCKEVLSHKAYCETWDQHPLSKCNCGLDELKAQLSILQGQK